MNLKDLPAQGKKTLGRLYVSQTGLSVHCLHTVCRFSLDEDQIIWGETGHLSCRNLDFG